MMKNPIPLTVLVNPPDQGMDWVVTVSMAVPEARTGTAHASSIGQAFQNALLIALASGPDHAEEMVS